MLFIQTFISVALSLAFIFQSPNESKRSEDEFIDWQENRRLNWTDFEGPVNHQSEAAALTSTFLGFQYRVKNNVFSYNIACRFAKKRSWGLIKNDWILNHEQGHFDISELFARYLHETITNYPLDFKNLKNDLDLIYQEHMELKEEFQNLYDTETDYSRNKEKQREWTQKINELLVEMKDYSDYRDPLPKKN
jgi:FtsZ-binding cell division protein ZapB